MLDLSEALADISAIRAQVAHGTQFRGYGPASVAASGILALAVAAIQSLAPAEAWRDSRTFLAVWLATAAVSAALSVADALVRARREHWGIANEMVRSALGQFMPAMAAGLLVTGVVVRFAPTEFWMLPGLWQLIFSLGVFASCRLLPRPLVVVGVWYLACALGSLILASGSHLPSPWLMGIPFGVGQRRRGRPQDAVVLILFGQAPRCVDVVRLGSALRATSRGLRC